MRKYRERSQPERREKLGLLEKKRDYKERATDYHKKEKTLNKLREKAALKNPDEFYMKMSKAKMVNGKLKLKEDTSSKDDMKKRMVDQSKNIGLISLKKQLEDSVRFWLCNAIIIENREAEFTTAFDRFSKGEYTYKVYRRCTRINRKWTNIRNSSSRAKDGS